MSKLSSNAREMMERKAAEQRARWKEARKRQPQAAAPPSMEQLFESVSPTDMTVVELVGFYGHGSGPIRDAVSVELKRRGSQARDEVIEMADSVSADLLAPEGPLGKEFTAIVDVLTGVLPSEESRQSLKRLESRIPEYEHTLARLRQN